MKKWKIFKRNEWRVGSTWFIPTVQNFIQKKNQSIAKKINFLEFVHDKMNSTIFVQTCETSLETSTRAPIDH